MRHAWMKSPTAGNWPDHGEIVNSAKKWAKWAKSWPDYGYFGDGLFDRMLLAGITYKNEFRYNIK